MLGFTQTGARALLEAFATITLSFVVFTFGSADSYSGCQRTADPATDRNDAAAQSRRQIHRRALHIYIDVRAQRPEPHGQGSPPAGDAAGDGVYSFAAFFHLIDYASRLLRPISLLAHVGAAGMAVTESVYPVLGHGSDEEGEAINPGPLAA